jgi:hypothetical protein
MQGGRRDVYLGSDADNSPLDVAYDSVNEITLSRGADTLVQKLRRAWIFLLATPIAWAHGQPHAQAMRRNKLRKIADGTATVVRTTHFLLKWPPSSPPGTAPKGFKYPKIQKSTIFTSLAWGLGRPQRVKVPKHPPLVLPLRTALSFRPFYTFVLLYFCTIVELGCVRGTTRVELLVDVLVEVLAGVLVGALVEALVEVLVDELVEVLVWMNSWI